jgi:hypothetical protein
LIPEDLGALVSLVANLLPRYGEGLKAGDLELTRFRGDLITL